MLKLSAVFDCTEALRADIDCDCAIDVTIDEVQLRAGFVTTEALAAEFASAHAISATMKDITTVDVTEIDDYEGSYRVIPKMQQQTLSTSGKRMTADVVVLEVPVYRTHNSDGGYTVYIANEVIQ